MSALPWKCILAFIVSWTEKQLTYSCRACWVWVTDYRYRVYSIASFKATVVFCATLWCFAPCTCLAAELLERQELCHPYITRVQQCQSLLRSRQCQCARAASCRVPGVCQPAGGRAGLGGSRSRVTAVQGVTNAAVWHHGRVLLHGSQPPQMLFPGPMALPAGSLATTCNSPAWG